MNANHLTTILFDMDGTLIDSEPVAARIAGQCFQEWGFQLQEEDAQYVTGRTWESALRFLFDKYRFPLDLEETRQVILQRYRKELEEDLPTIPGSATAVRELAGTYKLALVSGSHREDILWALKKLDILKHFQVILGAEDYPRSKPHPDGYLKALTLFGEQPKNALVFEDSTAGIQSAREAGIRVIAITHANHFKQDISNADLKIPDLRNINSTWIKDLSFDSI